MTYSNVFFCVEKITYFFWCRMVIGAMPQITVIHSPQCANCQRLLSILRRIPSLSNAQIVNVNQLGPAQLSTIQYVPTVIDQHGQQFVGTNAFEYLKKFEAEMELSPAPMPMGRGLEYATLEGPGENEYVEMFGDFEPPK